MCILSSWLVKRSTHNHNNYALGFSVRPRQRPQGLKALHAMPRVCVPGTPVPGTPAANFLWDEIRRALGWETDHCHVIRWIIDSGPKWSATSDEHCPAWGGHSGFHRTTHVASCSSSGIRTERMRLITELRLLRTFRGMQTTTNETVTWCTFAERKEYW